MPKIAAVIAGSEVNPCCCGCPDITQDIDVIISGQQACPSISFTGINGSFTAVWDAGASVWQVEVGTVTDPVQTLPAFLQLSCGDGLWFANIAAFGDIFNMYHSYDEGAPVGIPLGDPMPDFGSVGDCGVGTGHTIYGYGATITLSLP